MASGPVKHTCGPLGRLVRGNCGQDVYATRVNYGWMLSDPEDQNGDLKTVGRGFRRVGED